jgi:hypothetical protein
MRCGDVVALNGSAKVSPKSRRQRTRNEVAVPNQSWPANPIDRKMIDRQDDDKPIDRSKTDRQTGQWTDRQVNGQTDRSMDRQTDRSKQSMSAGR